MYDKLEKKYLKIETKQVIESPEWCNSLSRKSCWKTLSYTIPSVENSES